MLSRLFKKSYVDTCYNSIEEIPIFNWWKISDGETNYIQKFIKEIVPLEIKVKRIEKLQQEYFDTFGVSDEFANFFESKKELLDMECELHITGDKFLRTKINLLKKKLKSENDYQRKGNNYTVKAYLDKYMGVRLDPKEVSVKEYYTYLDLMKKEHGKDKKH